MQQVVSRVADGQIGCAAAHKAGVSAGHTGVDLGLLRATPLSKSCLGVQCNAAGCEQGGGWADGKCC